MIALLLTLIVVFSLGVAAVGVAIFEQLAIRYLLWRDARRRRAMYGVGGGR